MVQTPKVGDVIRIHSWHGVVIDIYKNDKGEAILKVQTARNVFRNFKPELIEVNLNPEAIAPATIDDLLEEIERLRQARDELMTEMIERANSLRKQEQSLFETA